MIRLSRPDLSDGAVRILDRRQAMVDNADDPAAEARRSWSTFAGATRVEILNTLKDMSSGLERCMYCEDSMGTDIDHFRPKSDFPPLSFRWSNYFLACSHCNSNAKRSEFPVSAGGQRELIDPVEDDPLTHLYFSPTTGRYVGRDQRGRESIRVFALNRQVCVDGRRNAWVALEALVILYAQEPARRAEILRTVTRFPFQGVRMHLQTVMSSRERERILRVEVIEALRDHPELLGPGN